MLGLLKSWFVALSTSAKIGVVAASVVGLGTVAAATNSTPAQPKQPPAVVQPAPVITHKDVSVKTPIPFKSSQVDDTTLAFGTKKTKVAGVNGEKQTIYDVTYSDGLEISRKLKSENVTVNPVDEVILNGTYIASNTGSGYYNVDGNYVSSPSASPVGASALCSDGSYSYSQHRSGTCSHHGGVARWL